MISQQYNWTYNINNQRQVTIDVGEWDRVTAQFVAPVTGTIFIYGTNDGGAIRGQGNGNAALATNFTAIQAVNLATGSAVSSITAAGLYKTDTNYKYLKFGGGGISVYKMITDHMKVY
jgi:hypothetical protein